MRHMDVDTIIDKSNIINYAYSSTFACAFNTTIEHANCNSFVTSIIISN